MPTPMIKRMIIMGMGHGAKPDNKKPFIKACQDCSAACETAYKYIEEHPEGFMPQLKNLLLDCSAFTKLMADFVDRNSVFAQEVAIEGKKICQQCREESAQFQGVEELVKVVQECDRVCHLNF